MFLPYTTGTLVVALVVTWLRARACNDRRNGVMLGLVVWSFSLLLTALPLLTYLVPYSVWVDRFIAACLAAAAIGYHIMRKPSIEPPTRLPYLRRDEAMAVWLGGAGIVGNLLVLVYVMRQGVHLTPSYLLHNLSAIRAKELATGASGAHGPIGLMGTLLAPASFLYLAIAFRLKINRPLVGANFAVIVLVGLFYYGGRQSIFIGVLLVVTGLWLRGVKIRVSPRTIVVGLVALIGVWYFATSFVAQRQGAQDERAVLQRSARADYGPWVASYASTNPTLGSELVQYSYLSSSIPSLTYYMNSGLAPRPLYGAYSLPIPWIFAGVVLGTYSTHQWSDARAKVVRPFKDTGYVENAWATLLRDLYADFGEIGAVVFCGLLGGFIAWARNRYEDTGEVFYHALETYAGLVFAFGAFQSLLYPDWMGNGFFFALAIVVVRHLAAPAGSRRARPRSRASRKSSLGLRPEVF